MAKLRERLRSSAVWRNPLKAPPTQERTVGEWGDSSIPSWSSHTLSSSGMPVTYDGAVSLSTVAAAIRQPSVLIAGLPLDVYDVTPDRRERTLASGKWQNGLLDYPDENRSGFDFWSDVSTHIDGCGNAVMFKIRERGRVSHLILLDPRRIKLDVDERGVRTFYYQRPGGPTVEFDASQVLHIRGWDDSGRPWARSPIERHRDALGKGTSRSAMEDKFLANDARPGVIIKMPGRPTREQVMEFLDLWNAQHRGNPGRAAVVGGGVDVETLPVSLRDAQFVESMEFGVTEVARIFDWPADLLERQTERPIAEVLTWATRIHLIPRMNRIQDALAADRDLFGPGSKFRPYFDPSEFLRGDFKTMAEVFHQLKQGGIMTANEGRLPLGLPRHPDGDELQATPVGGAPNSPSSVPPSGGGEAEPPDTEPAD